MRFLISALICCCLALSLTDGCKKPPQEDRPGDEGNNTEVVDEKDLEVVDGKVRFFLSWAPGGTREVLELNDFTGCKIQVNGKDCIPSKDTDGKWFIDVPENTDGEYTAARITSNSSRWYNGSPFSEVAIPVGQFFRAEVNELADYPCYARYTKENKNNLVFNDAYALLDIVVKGDATLTSVRASAPGGETLAGRGSYSPTEGTFTLLDGMSWASVNCTPEGNGVGMTGNEVHIPMIIVPGYYSEGIELTLCDASRKMVRQTVPAYSLAPGEVKTVRVEYKPADELIWYEGFDRLVWGGDFMGGKDSGGYAPDNSDPGTEGGADRTGTELATTRVPFDMPGTGYIQSNIWSEVEGFSVATSHRMTEGYIRSRGLDEYTYLFRCQEYPGMIAVGAANEKRGILRTPPLSNLDGYATVKLSFRFCFHPGATDNLLFEVLGGGVLTEVKVDGSSILSGADKFTYSDYASTWVGTHTELPLPASIDAVKTWHEVEATIRHATNGTCFYLAGKSSGSGNHGFFLDDIMVTRASDDSGRKGNLRLLYWNISNGMWADQHNNYDNFVAWVKKYDPDICVWCESASIYQDKSNSKLSEGDRYLPNGWPSLAARYGHGYTAVGGWRDNYPQTVTSKYPVTSILRITDTSLSNKPVSHGSAIQEVDVNGHKLWLVTCHMWPQAYAYGISNKDDQNVSKANHGGDRYREYEMNYIVSNTVNDSRYAAQQNWLLLGDTNSLSRVDNWYYDYSPDNTQFLTHDVILNKTNLKDVIAETCPGVFIPSGEGDVRIDFVYASPTMMARVVDALFLLDKWTMPAKSVWYSPFWEPSDHHPILVDFEIE